MRERASVHACVRACLRACVAACVRGCVRADDWLQTMYYNSTTQSFFFYFGDSIPLQKKTVCFACYSAFRVATPYVCAVRACMPVCMCVCGGACVHAHTRVWMGLQVVDWDRALWAAQHDYSIAMCLHPTKRASLRACVRVYVRALRALRAVHALSCASVCLST